MVTDLETRMTLNFARGEALGFDNKPIEFDDNHLKE